MNKPYVRPIAQPCDYCGIAVMHEFGVLDAASYEEGIVLSHICALPLVAPLNEREWLALQPKEDSPTPVYRRSAPAIDIVEEARQFLLAQKRAERMGDVWSR